MVRPVIYNYYAIVANDYKSAAEWVQQKNHVNIKQWLPTHLMFIMNKGDKYKIITRAEQAQGYNFIDSLVCPTSTDLLTEVRKRLI